MPGGRNTYTRPANKKQRAALKRRNARNAAVDNLRTRRDEVLLSEDNPNEFRVKDAKLRKMMADIEYANAEDRGILRQGIQRAKEREDSMYDMKSGGKVKKMKSGGKCRGMGAAKRGGDFMIG